MSYKADHSTKLTDVSPDANEGLSKRECKERVEKAAKLMFQLQDQLYAQSRNSMLIVFQAMDAAGKDGAVKHVMSGLNPQGCEVTSFKQPSAEELQHDYLWRVYQRLPAFGRIGIFNRSHYEDVLITRVHPEYLTSRGIAVDHQFWENRYEQIRHFEKHLAQNNTVILKFFLHISQEEQKKRFLERLEDSDKNWKFSSADLKERGFWKDYQRAYEKAIQATSTDEAPWFIVPSNNKWYARMVIAETIVRYLEKLSLSYPVVSQAHHAELEQARKQLERK